MLLLEELAPARVGNTIRGCSLEEVTTVLAAVATLHAAWWQDPALAASDWLRLRSMLTPAAMTTTFAQAWPSFLGKLGVPMSAQLVRERDWIAENLDQAAQRSYESAPRTLIHNDLQPDNLFFGDDPARPVVFIDWQMVTVGRGVVDAASVIRGSLAPEARPGLESGLVRAYHVALLQGVCTDTPLTNALRITSLRRCSPVLAWLSPSVSATDCPLIREPSGTNSFPA